MTNEEISEVLKKKGTMFTLRVLVEKHGFSMEDATKKIREVRHGK